MSFVRLTSFVLLWSKEKNFKLQGWVWLDVLSIQVWLDSERFPPWISRSLPSIRVRYTDVICVSCPAAKSLVELHLLRMSLDVLCLAPSHLSAVDAATLLVVPALCDQLIVMRMMANKNATHNPKVKSLLSCFLSFERVIILHLWLCNILNVYNMECFFFPFVWFVVCPGTTLDATFW